MEKAITALGTLPNTSRSTLDIFLFSLSLSLQRIHNEGRNPNCKPNQHKSIFKALAALSPTPVPPHPTSQTDNIFPCLALKQWQSRRKDAGCAVFLFVIYKIGHQDFGFFKETSLPESLLLSKLPRSPARSGRTSGGSQEPVPGL